ncbi:MAG TPA: hypothetical protein VJ691_03825 [Vicinamibacterales bacterium]|nr:hypothetical protein [Vicinamibacterales bacterium]
MRHSNLAVIRGINYPWTVFDGRANYGCDFGRNRWDSHTGVTANLAAVASDFAALGAARIEVARWFVFTDGRGGIRWNSAGEISGLDEEFFHDVDAALEIAARQGVRLCLVLLDYLWFDDPQRRLALLNGYAESAFLDRVLDPVLDRYGQSAAIHSFDVINEPDWVIHELATDRSRAVWPLERLRRFAGMTAERIRGRSNALITLGGGRVMAVREWDHPDYGLDFIQVHSYPHERRRFRQARVFRRPAADFGVSKPILIGEFAAGSIADCIVLARDGGYLGAWPWSYKGTDAVGAVDLNSLG